MKWIQLREPFNCRSKFMSSCVHCRFPKRLSIVGLVQVILQFVQWKREKKKIKNKKKTALANTDRYAHTHSDGPTSVNSAISVCVEVDTSYAAADVTSICVEANEMNT